MKNILHITFLLGLSLIVELCFALDKNNETEFNTALASNTYKISGKNSIGTCFFLVDFNPDSTFKYILVTATHVLDGIKEDSATLILRKKNGDIYTKLEHKIAIRSNNKNLYLSHKDVDVSVMFMNSWPVSAYKGVAIPVYFLADDNEFKRNDIHPGIAVRSLGYPLNFEANDAGFPILRSGNIASYPLFPSSIYSTFLVDIKIFKGNSGGPVYYSVDQRNMLIHGEGGVKRYDNILGLISQEKIKTENISTIYETEKKVTQMDIAVVVNASYIKELIDTLKLIR